MPFAVHHYHHIVRDPETVRFQEETFGILRSLQQGLTKMAHTLDDTLALITAQGTKLDSLDAFVDGLRKEVASETAGQISPEIQAKIDAVFDRASANTDKIDAALNANVTAPVNPASGA